MTEAAKAETKPQSPQDAKPKPVIHRVCISCNNMFTVTVDNYEAKHCPVCHKA